MNDIKEQVEYIHPRNQHNMLFEYYDRVSKPKDNDVLGNWQIWVYGSDREAFPPHCHIRLPNGSVEFEVSLLNWEVINIKHSDAPNSWDSIDKDIRKGFFEWLDRPSKERPNNTNKENMFMFWNGANSDNPLEKWVDKKDDIDDDLLIYLGKKIDYVRLSKDITAFLVDIYFQNAEERKRLHKLPYQELVRLAGYDMDISNDEKAIAVVTQAETNVYGWSTNVI